MRGRFHRRAFILGTASACAIPPRLRALEAPRSGGTLKVSVSLRINTLNPLRHINTSDYMAGELMYSGLTRLTRRLSAEPDIALAWTSNDQMTEWTFALRRDAMFRGVERRLTAHDVVASLQAVMNPATASPARTALAGVLGVEASGEDSVRIALKAPNADLPLALTHNDARILPAEIASGDLQALETTDFGTGPFKLARYEPGRFLRVERDTRYFKPGRPFLDAVEQRIYPDLASEYAALANGETDLLLTLAPTDFGQAQANPGLTTYRVSSGRFYNVVMRCDQKPFDDARVRKALQRCVDRDALVDLVMEGYATPAADNPISKQYAFHRDIQPIKPDIAEAKALLSQAGYPRGVKLTLFCANRPSARTALGVAIKEMAAPAGFDISVQTIAYDTYNASVWRKANFYVANWNMQPNEDAMFSQLFTSDAPWNDSRWNNTTFDALVERARQTPSPTERMRLYGDAQQLMTDDCPYLIPYFEDLLSASGSNVIGYETHPRGGQYYLENVWISGPRTRS